MKSAREIAAQIRSGQRAAINKSIMLYGAPKTGKTRLAATIAKIPKIETVYWFDAERGSDTIFSGQAGLTDEELDKIIPIFFRDTPDSPRAAETMLKALTGTAPVKIDQETGKVGTGDISFHYAKLGPETAVVFDTISQIADSVFALQLQKYTYRDNRKYWGEFHADMNAILSSIQSSAAYNVLIAQEQIIEGSTKEDEKNRAIAKTTDKQKTSAVMVQDDKLIPVCGSQAYSLKAAKYPSAVVRVYIEKKSYKQLSNPITMANVIGGSRAGVDAAAMTNPTMAKLLGLEK